LSNDFKGQITSVVRVAQNDNLFTVGDKSFHERNELDVDPGFFSLFSFPLIKGAPSTVLSDLNNVVLTESTAKKYFGSVDNALGKIITLNKTVPLTVTGIAKDVPSNSHLNFDIVLSLERHKNASWMTSWINNGVYTYVQTAPNISEQQIEKQLPAFVEKYLGSELRKYGFNWSLSLTPLTDVYFDSMARDNVKHGDKAVVYVFISIAVLILLIACINFMNLSTARSEKRAREVGIRKAVGSPRGQLIVQFLSESLFTAFLAFLLSLVLIQLLLPFLKDLGFEHVHLDFSNAPLLLSILAVCMITGLVSGSYPALYLSSFLPVKVLKGVIRQDWKTVSFRKALVVSQFVISIGLIISTVIVFQQISHARNRSVGYDPNNLVSITATEDMAKNFVALKQDLLNTGHIEVVAKVSSPLTAIYNTWSNFSWDGKDPNSDMALDVVMTEFDYEKAARLQFIAGRPFLREHKTDSNAVIINEAALNMIGYKDPIEKTMKLGDQTLTIIGVIKNVVMKDPFQPVPPGVILFAANMNAVLVRLKHGADLKTALAAMKPIVEKYNPSLPFEYSFVDEEFGKKFETEKRVAKLAGIFAGLAILISCLGLFGLAMFMAERRSKEISIRKVLGASVTNLWLLLSKEFVWLVAIACIIASPLALWLMSNWLQKYDYRIDISWWIFAIAGSLAVIIALITVSTQAIRAAIANPVNRLRSE
jgi:putative ABC transport system permease protein